jgi:hypothetical protein
MRAAVTQRDRFGSIRPFVRSRCARVRTRIPSKRLNELTMGGAGLAI